MAANVNAVHVPTITIVDSAERIKRRSCCGCVPESVGVFAILSMYFFLGVFYAAASFVSLGFYKNAAVIAILSISGILHTFLAISSALGVIAIRKENVVMMRRLSFVFWILTAFMLILNVVMFAFQIIIKPETVQDCKDSINGLYGAEYVDCNQLVNDTLISEGIKLFIIQSISVYFAYVIHRFTKRMKESPLPLPITSSVDGQRTPTYFVYSTHPPTSNDWVPPPTYTVRATNPLPDGFNPDSKQAPN